MYNTVVWCGHDFNILVRPMKMYIKYVYRSVNTPTRSVSEWSKLNRTKPLKRKGQT